MPHNDGIKTFLAGEALAAKRRVKISSGTTTTPPEVVYADAGEDFIGVTEYAVPIGDDVSVRLQNSSGTFEIECTVSSSIVRGTVLYGANDGKVSDASSGSAQGEALEPGVTGQQLEVAPWNVKSTTAATVSVADANSNMTGATVEAVLDEHAKALKTAQYQINPTLVCLADGTRLDKFVNGASTVPGIYQSSSKDVGYRWNNDAAPGSIAAKFNIPQDVDVTANLVVHLLGAIVKAGAGEVDAPHVTVGAYFSTVGADPGADTNCGGDSGQFLTAQAAKYQEKTLTIALADVPANPSVLTLLVAPKTGELGTDDFILSGIWIEATRAALTT